jgi:hypothetical protein
MFVYTVHVVYCTYSRSIQHDFLVGFFDFSVRFCMVKTGNQRNATLKVFASLYE